MYRKNTILSKVYFSKLKMLITTLSSTAAGYITALFVNFIPLFDSERKLQLYLHFVIPF